MESSFHSKTSIFNDLIGHDLPVLILESAILKSHISSAYLFVGPDGVGKRLATFRFLEGVINQGIPDERARRRLESFNHPDLLWVEPSYMYKGQLITKSQAIKQEVPQKAPPKIRLEQIRSITKFLSGKPIESNRGMVVIEDVDSMQEAAANALLKTLEEPGHGLLILISSYPERLLPTIRSRCQQINFGRLSVASLKKILLKVDKNKQALALLDQSRNNELLSLSEGSPGGLIKNLNMWESLPAKLLTRIQQLPNTSMELLSLAGELTETLSNEEQLWLVSWLEHSLWMTRQDERPIRRLEKLRQHLLSYVQPRLAWEIAFLEIKNFI